MWGGQCIYTENNFPAVLDAIHDFAATKSSQDTEAAEITVGLSLFDIKFHE
jgi:precorrin-6x reductase